MLDGGQAEWPSRAVTGSEVWGGNKSPSHSPEGNRDPPHTEQGRILGNPVAVSHGTAWPSSHADKSSLQCRGPRPSSPSAVRRFLGVFGYTLKWVLLHWEKPEQQDGEREAGEGGNRRSHSSCTLRMGATCGPACSCGKESRPLGAGACVEDL